MKEKNESFFFEGNNNQGILLCHGLTGSPKNMLELGKYLNKLGYTVSCPQYKGHGSESKKFLQTNVDMWFKDIVDEVDNLKEKVNGIYVMGLSMGGSFAIKVAQIYDVKALVTMNAPLIGLPLKEEFTKLNYESDDEE